MGEGLFGDRGFSGMAGRMGMAAETDRVCVPGTVGVVAVTAGPGLTNTVTAVKNAQIAQSPVLLLGGAASTLLQVPYSRGAERLQGCSKGSHGNFPGPLSTRNGVHSRPLIRCPCSGHSASSVLPCGGYGTSCPP